jgi:hypothetical protein
MEFFGPTLLRHFLHKKSDFLEFSKTSLTWFFCIILCKYWLTLYHNLTELIYVFWNTEHDLHQISKFSAYRKAVQYWCGAADGSTKNIHWYKYSWIVETLNSDIPVLRYLQLSLRKSLALMLTSLPCRGTVCLLYFLQFLCPSPDAFWVHHKLYLCVYMAWTEKLLDTGFAGCPSQRSMGMQYCLN